MRTTLKVGVQFAPNSKTFNAIVKELFQTKLQQMEVTQKTA